MNTSRIIAITALSLASATGAFAQSAFSTIPYRAPRPIVQMDPLDPVSRVAVLARRGFDTPDTTPVRVSGRPADVRRDYAAAPAVEPVTAAAPVLAPKPSRFLSALEGISQSLQLSHEALGVYEHAIEANALKNGYGVR